MKRLTWTHFPTHGFTAAQINKLAVAKMKMKTTASSFLESLSVSSVTISDHVCSVSIGIHATRKVARTKTRRKNIFHSCPFTNRQIVIQTKLSITIIAIPRSVFFSILPLSISPSIPLFRRRHIPITTFIGRAFWQRFFCLMFLLW